MGRERCSNSRGCVGWECVFSAAQEDPPTTCAAVSVAWLAAAPSLASARLCTLAAAGLAAEACVVWLAAALGRSALAARHRARLLAFARCSTASSSALWSSCTHAHRRWWRQANGCSPAAAARRQDRVLSAPQVVRSAANHGRWQRTHGCRVLSAPQKRAPLYIADGGGGYTAAAPLLLLVGGIGCCPPLQKCSPLPIIDGGCGHTAAPPQKKNGAPPWVRRAGGAAWCREEMCALRPPAQERTLLVASIEPPNPQSLV